MTTWNHVLNCVVNNDFETLENALDIPRDNARAASERCALEIANRIIDNDHSNVNEAIQYFVSCPYLDRTTFVEQLRLLCNP